MSTDVAIVGIGIHPFGRTDGVSGRAQGAFAARQALADAGVQWSDIQFAYGGSHAAGDADSLVSDLGLTGAPFINVHHGCGTGGRSEEHASELQSLMRISYAVFCLKKKKTT